MDIVILAGGFGTRLYPLTENIPKALLKINNIPLIEYLLKKIKELNEIENIYILSNNKFYINFLEWFNEFKNKDEISNKIKILTNGINSENERKNAIYDLKKALEMINSDFFLFASDNLFDFDLNKIIESSKNKDSSVIALKRVEDKELIKKYSAVLMDEEKRIIDFEEKPENPKSDIASVGCYFIKEKDTLKIKKDEFKNRDNLGCIVEFLHKNSQIYGIVYEDFWFDIGSFEELEKIQKFLKELK